MRFFTERHANAKLRDIDRTLARWVECKGGSKALIEIAPWVNHADGNAHAALPLYANDHYGIVADPEVFKHDALVGDGATQTPFVLDQDLLYLYRNYAAERNCADAINARRAQATTSELEPIIPDNVDTLQALAITNVLGKKLFILTGGPGTGKTTTVKHMLNALQLDGTKNIVIAAPTGKAAQRLSESLGSEFGTDPLTVHRFLNTETKTADILVIDEASMLDLWMLQSILAAIREDATLILVGDANQLNSVGTGSVFSDIVKAFQETDGTDCIVLEKSFRANHTVNALNEAVLHNRAEELDVILNSNPIKDNVAEWAAGLFDGMVAPLQGKMKSDENAREAFKNAGKRQLLTALRHGKLGSLNVSKQIEQQLKRRLDLKDDAKAFQGQLLLVTGNDYSLKLFNGDVGVVFESSPGTFEVAFEATDGSIKWHNLESLNQVESAFAMTIHKSQGSEYDEVALLLPDKGESKILSKQLIYTGISRARNNAAVWGTVEVVRQGLDLTAKRYGGLQQRLTGG